MDQPPQPRKYRIRVYADGVEVLADRQTLAVLDLTAGPGLRRAEGQLDRLLLSLARADGNRGDHYHLAVEDWETGQLVCHWPA